MNFICPFHNDHNASMIYNKNSFFCYGCKKRFFNYKNKNNNVRIKNFDNIFENNIFYFANKYLLYKKNIWLNYLLKRNITLDLIVKYNIGCIDIKINKKKILKNKLIFPIFNDKNKIIGVGLKTKTNKPKYINLFKNFIDKNNILYGIHNNILKNFTLIVEGYFDLYTLNHHRIYNVFSTFGCSINNKKIKILSELYKKVIFCYDGDHAGYISLNKVNFFIKKNNYKNLIIKIMPLGLDPDLFINKYGIFNFLKFIKIK